MIRSARSSGCGRSSRTSASGSSGGPSSPIATPAARCAAAGAKRSRPWNVREIDSSAYVGVRELVRGLDPRALGGRDQQAVVGPDVERPSRSRSASGPARAADTGVDDGEVAPDRHVRDRVREHQRALEDLLRRDPVRDVDDLRLRRDPLDHAVAGADEVVLEPEVAQEGDEHAAEPIAASEPGDVVRPASRDDLDARRPRRLRRLRADADRRDVGAERGRTRGRPTPRRARRGRPRAPASGVSSRVR